MKMRSSFAVCGVWCVLATLGGCVPSEVGTEDPGGGASGAAGGAGGVTRGSGGNTGGGGRNAQGSGGDPEDGSEGGGGQSTGAGGAGGGGMTGGAGGGGATGGAGGGGATGGAGGGPNADIWSDGDVIAVKTEVQIGPHASVTADARCPESHPIPMAGGFSTPNSALRVLDSKPIGWTQPEHWTNPDPAKRAGWVVTFYNVNSAGHTFQVHIVCRAGQPPPAGTIFEKTALDSDPGGHDIGASVWGEIGTVPWGGGFHLDSLATLQLSLPGDTWAEPSGWDSPNNEDRPSWQASAYTAVSNNMLVHMVFGTVGPLSTTDDIRKIVVTEQVAAGGAHAIATCPSSHPVPVTGGAGGSSSSFNVLQSYPTGWDKPSTWWTANGTGARWHTAMDNTAADFRHASAAIVCRALRAGETLPPRKLRSKAVSCPMSSDSLPVLASGDWSGDVEVWGGKIYQAREGRLFAGDPGTPAAGLTEIASSEDWNGDVELSDGYIYVARDAQLHGAKLSDDGLDVDAPLTLISDSGPWGDRWAGDIEIGGGHVYLAKSGNLWRTPIGALQVSLVSPAPASAPNGLTLFSGGGWAVDYEVSDGTMYVLAGTKLYRAPVGQSLVACGDILPGDFEVVGGVLYVASPE